MYMNNHLVKSVFSLMAVLTALSNGLYGVTVTLTDPDPAVVMGSLINDDEDAYSTLALSFDGTVSKPYISTRYPTRGFYSTPRRGVSEFSLQTLTEVSQDPNAIESAVLRFYFDDVIFPDFALAPWTAQAFTVEAYTDTANGTLDAADVNDANALVPGEGLDDWAGDVVQSWEFVAGEVDYNSPGAVVGVFGPDEPFPADYGDDQFAIFGLIGFEVDVTDLVRQALMDPNTDYLGFRWISRSEGGFWTSMDPQGYLPALTVNMSADGPLNFALQSSDGGEITDDHGGRPYHIFDDPNDEAIYTSVRDWQGAHDPSESVAWPLSDGIVDWDTFADPNRSPDATGVTAVTPDGPKSVYWDPVAEDYILVSDETNADGALEKVYYAEGYANRSLSFGNNGIPAGGTADRQYALITEFNLQRPNRYNLDPNTLVSAALELTIDRIIDMSLGGNNLALLPSLLYVNAFEGDGILNDYANVQADFERIDPNTADAAIWLTVEGTPGGTPITDFALSYWKLVDPGLGEPLTLFIDVTEAVRARLEEGAGFAGFALSGSPDGDYTLASVDLVDLVTGKSYLPRLVLETRLQ